MPRCQTHAAHACTWPPNNSKTIPIKQWACDFRNNSWWNVRCDYLPSKICGLWTERLTLAPQRASETSELNGWSGVCWATVEISGFSGHIECPSAFRDSMWNLAWQWKVQWCFDYKNRAMIAGCSLANIILKFTVHHWSFMCSTCKSCWKSSHHSACGLLPWVGLVSRSLCRGPELCSLRRITLLLCSDSALTCGNLRLAT